MAKAQPVITMSAREVVAFRGEFKPRGESYSDPGVARDEIASLEARQDPVVLRVASRRLSAKARASVDGDWLCEPGAGAVRVPKPAWERSFSAEEWSFKREWVEAWETCDQAGWMAHAATAVGCDRRLVVTALCACVREFEPRHPFRGKKHVTSILNDTEAWAHREASGRSPDESAKLHRPRSENSVVRGGGARVRAMIYGATSAAACHAAPSAKDAAWHAANSVESIVHAISQGGEATRESVSADLSDVLRRHITTLDVLRAASLHGRR